MVDHGLLFGSNRGNNEPEIRLGKFSTREKTTSRNQEAQTQQKKDYIKKRKKMFAVFTAEE